MAAYERPWWRDEGLSGTAMGDAEVPVKLVFDGMPVGEERGMIFGFLNLTRELDPALLSGAEARRRAFEDSLVAYFGERAREMVAFAEGDWSSEPWAGGCGSHPGPGVLTAFGSTLREPVGPIFWAGTETSPHWHSFLDGAVCAGERAAREALAHLDR